MGPKEESDALNELIKGKRSYNRADRRRKPPTDNIYTKATHNIKKERAKNAPTKQQRQRAIAKARKARKEAYTQIS